jgi:large subunit ribosomal protein L13
MKVINAENCVAGRLASFVAKMLLEGEEIVIVNAEKAVVTGNPKTIEEFFGGKISRGDPYHGPFYPKKSDNILRRIIRGMLPFHKPRGRKAYKRLKVYKSIPEEFKNTESEVISKAKSKSECKFIYLEDISKKFGG